MGKNRTLRILGNIIGNVVVHKVVIRNTHKPESIPHMAHEVGTYGLNASEIAEEYNWNCEDKMKISLEALKKFKKNMQKYYSDVEFSKEEVPILIKETIEEYI